MDRVRPTGECDGLTIADIRQIAGLVADPGPGTSAPRDRTVGPAADPPPSAVVDGVGASRAVWSRRGGPGAVDEQALAGSGCCGCSGCSGHCRGWTRCRVPVTDRSALSDGGRRALLHQSGRGRLSDDSGAAVVVDSPGELVPPDAVEVVLCSLPTEGWFFGPSGEEPTVPLERVLSAGAAAEFAAILNRLP